MEKDIISDFPKGSPNTDYAQYFSGDSFLAPLSNASGKMPAMTMVVDPLPEDATQFVKDYYDYYKTLRG